MNKTISLATLAGVVLILAFAINLSPIDNQATAQETTPFPSREKVISVTGTATTSVDPDRLVIQFGVETQEKTAKASLETNSQLMTNVVNAIMAVGITEDELSTSRMNISPIYDYYNEPQGILEDAVLNAKSKAEKALAPLNHKIIGVKLVSLSEFGMPPPMPYLRDGFVMAESASMKAATPVFSSDQDITTTASVIFLIGSN
jgi:uncharacterized protein YggE